MRRTTWCTFLAAKKKTPPTKKNIEQIEFYIPAQMMSLNFQPILSNFLVNI